MFEPTSSRTPLLTRDSTSDRACFSAEGFRFFLRRQFLSSERYGHLFALFLFRIRWRENGDELRKLLSSVKRSVRRTDVVGEFDARTVGVIVQHATQEAADRVSERFRSELPCVLSDNGNACCVASAVYPSEANTQTTLISIAEERLRQAELEDG
jgi:hypothetical protein